MATLISSSLVLTTETNGNTYTSTSSFSVTGGSDKKLIVVAQFSQGTANTAGLITCTAGGVSMTLDGEGVDSNGGSYGHTAIFRLDAPTAGAKSIVVNANGGNLWRSCTLFCFEWQNLGSLLNTPSATQGDINTVLNRSYTPQTTGSTIISAITTRRDTTDPFTPDSGMTEYLDTSSGGGTATNDHSAWIGLRTSPGTSSINVGATGTLDNSAIMLVVEYADVSPTPRRLFFIT